MNPILDQIAVTRRVATLDATALRQALGLPEGSTVEFGDGYVAVSWEVVAAPPKPAKRAPTAAPPPPPAAADDKELM